MATIRDLPRVASPHPTPPRLTYCSHAVLIPFPVPCLLCSRSANQANYSALHGLPLYMNQINTAILRIVSGNDDLSITTTMHPMPRKTCRDFCVFSFRTSCTFSVNISVCILVYASRHRSIREPMNYPGFFLRTVLYFVLLGTHVRGLVQQTSYMF